MPAAKKEPTPDGLVLRPADALASREVAETHEKFGTILKISGNAPGGLVFANRASPRYAFEI